MPEGPTPAHLPPLADAALVPDEVAHRSFSTGFRGYDQQEVRGFLTRVASELRVMQDRERELRRRLDALERQAPAVPAPAQPDEEQLVAVLGAEAARVLQAAREAANEIRTKAEEHVARLVREAQDEAARLRNEAEQLLDVRAGEAEQAAEAIRADATREAEAEIERARARGREMVAEAQAVRERLLRDLARRRRVAHQQIEQLRAGRDRLLDAYRVVRQTLEDATAELSRAEPEARAAAEAAAHRGAGEPELSVEDLEAELASAREIGTLPGEAEPVSASVDEPVAPPSEPEPVAPSEPEPARAEAEATAPPVPVPEPEPAEPTPERDPEPTPAAGSADEPAGGNGDERRSSALRLLRRRREPEPEREGELTTVDVGDPVEGVRILRPERQPEPETAAPETVPAAEAVDEPEPEPEPGEEAAGERRPARVEELFARIRAEREASVAQAEAVLAEAAIEPEAEADTDAAPTEAAPDETEAAGATTEADSGEPAGVATEEADAVEPAGDEALLERRDQRIEGLERQATRALKRVLADDQNEVLDRLRRHTGAPTADVLWPDRAAHTDRYAGAVRHALAAAALEGSVFGGDGPAAAVSVDDLVEGLATELTTALRDRVSDGGDEPPSDDAFVSRVSAAYREMKTQRVEGLVRDATAAAFNRGIYAAVPEGAPVRWIVDFDGRPCPDGEDDALAGPLEKGKAFPTGQCHPPAHAGCRCLLVPDTL